MKIIEKTNQAFTTSCDVVVTPSVTRLGDFFDNLGDILGTLAWQFFLEK